MPIEAPEIYGREAISNIVRALPPLERAYSRVRFSILRPKLLSVMDLLLTDEGRILDVGCGFGLFAAYFGQTHGRRQIVGIDPDARRIGMARDVAREGLARRSMPSSSGTSALPPWRAASTPRTCST